jgi:Cu(I)/Ag(I) efflux system membrane fusion protein
MTMEFGLADRELIKGIMPGEPVRFTFEDRGDGEFVIVKVEQAGAAAHKGH